MLHAFCMYRKLETFWPNWHKWSNRQGISKACLTKKCCILWLQFILLWHFQEVWGKNWLLSILKFNLRLDRVTVVRYGKWMGPISKADVVNCDQFVTTTNPPPRSLEQGHTPVFALNWEKRFVRRGEIVSIIWWRKHGTDLTDVKRKKIFVSVSPGAEIATKSSATTVGSELMFILKDDKGRL